jgi:hypothetical protein
MAYQRDNTMNGISTLTEIRKRGIDPSLRELGPVGMAKFLQDREMGKGDYTKDRLKWQRGKTVRDVVQEIRQKKRKRL